MKINFVRSTQFDVHSRLWICDDSCFNRRPNSGNSKLCRDSEQIVGFVCSVNSSRVGLKPTKCLVKVRRDTEDASYNMVIFTGGNLFIQFIKLLKQPLRHRIFTLFQHYKRSCLLMGKFSEAIVHCPNYTVYAGRHRALPWLQVNNEITKVV